MGESALTGILFAIFLSIVIALGFGGCAAYAKFNVWSSSLEGEAELKKADWNRQIAVREAQAKKDSARLLAEAEIERAKGVAKANEIIGNSLKNNEDYLRYLWIDHINTTQNQIIYVPTEASLPILEAGRRSK
jgi:regulator of protease activity HflC (stomatin/prohibitin superfamily)